MEFYNVRLLPKGLPEIIAQLVPYEIYPCTKVIAYPRKYGQQLGHAGYDDLTFSFRIGLYPTMCCSNGGHGPSYPGTHSFQLWMSMLSTAIHEIGHLATYELYYGMPHDVDQNYEAHRYVERLANEWKERVMARILRVDPRFGQPSGALTGYPGILAYRLRNWGKPWNKGEYNYYRQAEWRGLSCGAQVTVNDIAQKLILEGGRLSEHELRPEGWTREKARYRRAIHRGVEALGICRYFTNKNGRRYLMFNAGEAEAVYEWVVDNESVLEDAYRRLKQQQQYWRWELIEGNWELVGIDSPEKVPPEQMRLRLRRSHRVKVT